MSATIDVIVEPVIAVPPAPVPVPYQDVETMPAPAVLSKEASAKRQTENGLRFPDRALIGSCGEVARVLSEGTEVPPEFAFAAALTLFGSIACEAGLKLDIGIGVEPRLYTVLLGESGEVKKSTAIRRTVEFFKGLRLPRMVPFHDLNGVASAEGLARELGDVSNTVLIFDEMRAFLDKCKIQGSALLSAVASLFEGGNWDNATKSARHSVTIRDAKVSLLAACTTKTWEGVWGSDAISIGLPNRLLVIYGEARPRVAWPKAANTEALAKVGTRIEGQFARLPLTLAITGDAKQAWEDWYHSQPGSEHAKRLDTIGFRLMALLALSLDKDTVDIDVAQAVLAILDYELAIRKYHDPIDADSVIAKLEEKIRRKVQLGDLYKRDLRRVISADRAGIWAFDRALENLERAGDLTMKGNLVISPTASARLSAPDRKA
jgi:hypothetical protein